MLLLTYAGVLALKASVYFLLTVVQDFLILFALTTLEDVCGDQIKGFSEKLLQ